ncbi:glutathione S-transferase-like protein [Aminobacter sp. J44]|nr:glutathione S-transferase-like protein [Aminobacter sp. J44]
MKLYYSPGACSLAVHLVANEAAVPLDLVRVDLATKKTEAGDDFLAVNPNGYVPTLLTADGDSLTEAQILVQFIADQKPESGLMPAFGSIDRYCAQRWLAFISSELHKASARCSSRARARMRRQPRVSISPSASPISTHTSRITSTSSATPSRLPMPISGPCSAGRASSTSTPRPTRTSSASWVPLPPALRSRRHCRKKVSLNKAAGPVRAPCPHLLFKSNPTCPKNLPPISRSGGHPRGAP